ncbi:7TM diverse intracellular signaling domain-containing protein [uncultured Croceitalea sp.]|uniref:sensor histidine kinase n=1 Tax=uncultured Croceitalea sp. TaxID=1798908 RepID=UPI0033062EA3
MKINYFNTCFALFILGIQFCFGQKTIEVNPLLQKNIKINSQLHVSKEKAITPTLTALRKFDLAMDERRFFYLDFDVTQAYTTFKIANTTKHKQDMVLVFSYPFIEDAKLFKVVNDSLYPQGQIGIFSGKGPIGRNWKIPILSLPNETSNYLLVLKKAPGKPVATDITLFSNEKHVAVSGLQNTLIGFYFGITVLSILFTLFIFGLTRHSVFLLYGFYLVALAIYIASYFGFSNVFLPAEQLNNGRTVYVLAIEFSTILFVLFAQKLLRAKKYLPKLNRTVIVVIIAAIAVFRVILHIIGDALTVGQFAIFMKLWYGTILFLILAVLIELLVYIKHNPRIGSLFALSYLFMILGAVFVVLHQSIGLLKVTFFGLSHILFASALEIILLSITIAFIVGQIYKDRNTLASTMLVEQQRFLNAFVLGQEEERKRLGAELHDNVGSRISNLRRVFSHKHTDVAIEKEFDMVCDEIRNMAHAITPAEIALVGLPGAVEELLEELAKSDSLKINFNSFRFPDNLEEDMATNLFRIVQELLQNVFKHANASVVDIQLFGHKNSVTLSFEDDGQGTSHKKKTSGIGLKSIQSRVAQMNGQFLFDSIKGKGTSVLVIIPTKYT